MFDHFWWIILILEVCMIMDANLFYLKTSQMANGAARIGDIQDLVWRGSDVKLKQKMRFYLI